MIVGILKVQLFMPEVNSLKSKRKEIRSIKDKLRHHFNLSVSEVEHQDLWQRSTLGIAVVGNEYSFVKETLDRISDFIEKNWSYLLLELYSEILKL